MTDQQAAFIRDAIAQHDGGTYPLCFSAGLSLPSFSSIFGAPRD